MILLQKCINNIYWEIRSFYFYRLIKLIHSRKAVLCIFSLDTVFNHHYCRLSAAGGNAMG